MAENSPCYGCMERTLGCHGQCPRYGAWQAERAKEYDIRKELATIYAASETKLRSTRTKILKKARYSK